MKQFKGKVLNFFAYLMTIITIICIFLFIISGTKLGGELCLYITIPMLFFLLFSVLCGGLAIEKNKK